MPRRVRDASLETRTARTRLKVQHKPYFRLIEPGLHLGYRKLADGPGMWVVRRYRGSGAYKVENLRTPEDLLVVADDFADADGEAVMTFGQAQVAARKRPGRPTGPYTVGDAVDAYISFLKSDGRPKAATDDVARRDRAHIRPKIGTVKLSSLTTDRLRRWRDGLAETAPRLRTRKGEEQKHRPMNTTDEGLRARRASVNRTWTTLRAALNHAFRDGKAETDAPWRKVQPFRSVDSARTRYLTIDEAKRLINSCDTNFRPVVRAALQTGARYGELCRLVVSDFNPDVGTVAIKQSKSGKSRHVVLTKEGSAFFESLAAGKSGDAPMFGRVWKASHQNRPMREAVARAKIKPGITFHGLRHTWASHAIMNGVPTLVVAKNLGHADGRMVERSYGHLAQTYVTDAIRENAPKFGAVKGEAKILPMSRKRR